MWSTCFFKKLINFFLSNFRFIANLSGNYRVPVHTLPHPCPVSPAMGIPHKSGYVCYCDEPTLSHHYHPNSIFYVRVHSWCSTTLKFFCALPIHPTSLTLGNQWSFYCLHSFAFSRMSYCWNHTICSLFRLAAFM